MQLISNLSSPFHKDLINKLIAQSEEIIICIAFLKSTGLDFIIKKLNNKIGKCKFFVGTDYYLTEPQAVRSLFSKGHSVFRIKKTNSTFHPKIYYFRKGKFVSILVGSANLTGGGLATNFEVSILLEIKINSSTDKEFKKIIETYSRHSTKFDNEFSLSQYAFEYEKYRKKHKKADKEFKNELKAVPKFDLSKLPKYATEYKNDQEYANEFNTRTKNYVTARRLLNEITRAYISSPDKFLNYYDQIAVLFHSSGLLRGKKTLAKKYKTILSIFKLVQKNKNLKPKILFAKTLPLVHSIKRYGINALTELMNTYNSNTYSVANGRTLKSLSKLGIQEFPSPNAFNAETYERYNNLITEIAIKCNFKNLGHVDNFLNWYYVNYVKKNKKK